MRITTALSAVLGVAAAVTLVAVPAAATEIAAITGTAASDQLRGTDGADTILALAGDDVVKSFAGADTVDAGPGHDTVLAGDGDDVVSGGDGDDLLRGQIGADSIDGGSGEDLLVGGPGIDRLTGGTGHDGIALTGDVFGGVDVSAPGRNVVNTPDELLDFDPAADLLVLDRSDLRVDSLIDVENGTVEQLTALGADGADAEVVVLQGAVGNAGAAATAIAGTGVASGPGIFVYWNTSLLINRVVYSTDLGDPTADISVLGNIRTLAGDAALNSLPDFADTAFTTKP